MNGDEQCEGMIMQVEETLCAAEEGVKSGRRASLKIGQQRLQGITQLRAAAVAKTMEKDGSCNMASTRQRSSFNPFDGIPYMNQSSSIRQGTGPA